MEKQYRSLAKAISWRILASLTTALLVLLFTGSIVLSASISVLEIFLKFLLYYCHERVWNVVKWGRREP